VPGRAVVPFRMSADLEAGVKRIADFCGITIDPAAMPRILERCSFAFMREHDARFSLGAPLLPIPAGSQSAFIRKGQVGGWRQELDARSVSDFQEACDRRLRDLGEDVFRVLSGRGAREAGCGTAEATQGFALSVAGRGRQGRGRASNSGPGRKPL
jgi:hypothetical protein